MLRAMEDQTETMTSEVAPPKSAIDDHLSPFFPSFRQSWHNSRVATSRWRHILLPEQIDGDRTFSEE